MARTRREKTLADYLVIAISPILIMTLVGSLAYFLLAVGYRGGDELRVRWVMFWYVMGAVLVARIAIEQGRERAYLLGAGLAGVVALFIYRFIPGDATLIAWGLQVVIWWTSSKLTWDCTLIDEDADSSGSGLIEAAGLVGQPQTPLPATGTPNATSTLINDAPATGWRRWLPGGQRSGQRPHAPGLWIVYFSLAALPLFGLGQLLIPAHETDRRAYAFQLLMVYVASALGLLLTTSFLGLRRYLRQRRLQMPTAMAATWVAMGAGLALILLLLALLIPRPQGEYTISQWIDKVDNRVREASRFAVIREGQGQGAGRPVGTPQPDQKPRDPAAAPATDPAGNQAAPQPGQQPGPAGAPQASGTGGHPNPPPGNGPGQSPKGQSSQGSGSQPGQSEGSQPDQKSSNSSSAGQNQAGSQPQTNSRDAKPSSAGRTENPTNQGKNPGQPQPPNNQPGNQPRNQSGNQANPQANQQTDNPPRNAPSDPQNPPPGQQAQAPNKAAESSPASSPQSPPPGPPAPSPSFLTGLLASLAPFVKWILYGIIALVAAYGLYRYWGPFVELLRNLWNELLSLFGLGTRDDATQSGTANPQAPAAPLPFSSFDDPFLHGTARRMSPTQLVSYTFEALEAWAREQGIPRGPDQTPLEYASELVRRLPQAGPDIQAATQVYVQVAYNRGKLTEASFKTLEKIWQRMNVMASV